MICLKCDNEQFTPGETEVKQEFRGETLHVRTPVMLCQSCGWHTVGNDQIAELRRRTADAYRKKHNLLTSAQIKAMREALGMSQAAFAKFLRVGEASVKRWETWLVQDASSDELIRVKCVLAKKAQLLKRMTQAFLENQAAGWTIVAQPRAAEQSYSLLSSLSRYIYTGRNEPDVIPLAPIAVSPALSAAEFSSLWHSWSSSVALATEPLRVPLGPVQFYAPTTDYATNLGPPTPWLPGLSQDATQTAFSRETTPNYRRDSSNEPALAAAA